MKECLLEQDRIDVKAMEKSCCRVNRISRRGKQVSNFIAADGSQVTLL